MRWRVFRLGLYTLLLGMTTLVGLACVGLLLAGWAEPSHLERKGRLIGVEETASYRLNGGVVSEYRLSSDSDLKVDLAVRVPDRSLAHRPLLLLMGGQETGRAAVRVIPDTRGVTVAAISYPFGLVPHREPLSLAMGLPGIQQGIYDTPAAALLALDFLMDPGSGLNPGRVELAGISFGAYLAAVPAALDARIDRLWLIHGGAAAAATLDYGLRRHIPLAPLRRAVAGFLATVVGAGHLGPERWVARVSPRPLILVHAREDDDLPAVALEALHEAVRQPFEIVWTPGKHVHPKRPEVIAAISDLMFSRIAGSARTATGGRSEPVQPASSS